METAISQYLLLLYIPIGFYIAHRVCPTTKLYLKIIILLPTFTAILSLSQMITAEYNPHLMDLFREISSLIVYILLAFLLSGKRILKNIDSDGICEREQE